MWPFPLLPVDGGRGGQHRLLGAVMAGVVVVVVVAAEVVAVRHHLGHCPGRWGPGGAPQEEVAMASRGASSYKAASTITTTEVTSDSGAGTAETRPY